MVGPLDRITEEIAGAQRTIQTVFGVTPRNFIVPHYRYGDNVITAMKATPPMDIVSGRCAWSHGTTTVDQSIYCLDNDKVSVATGIVVDGIARIPAGAVIGCDVTYFDDWGRSGKFRLRQSLGRGPTRKPRLRVARVAPERVCYRHP